MNKEKRDEILARNKKRYSEIKQREEEIIQNVVDIHGDDIYGLKDVFDD